MHASSLDKMKLFHNKYLKNKAGKNINILDLGSMNVNGTYRDILNDPNWTYTGIDMEAGSGVDIVLKEPYHWREIKSNSADVLISGQAFEHIEYFWVTILEIFRVLKPGGICCILAPSSGAEHKYPVDCWRFYPDGFSAMAKFAQLDVLSSETQWESKGYEDGSDIWQDSMLIARKPTFSPWLKIKSEAKCFLQHRALLMSTK